MNSEFHMRFSNCQLNSLFYRSIVALSIEKQQTMCHLKLLHTSTWDEKIAQVWVTFKYEYWKANLSIKFYIMAVQTSIDCEWNMCVISCHRAKLALIRKNEKFIWSFKMPINLKIQDFQLIADCTTWFELIFRELANEALFSKKRASRVEYVEWYNSKKNLSEYFEYHNCFYEFLVEFDTSIKNAYIKCLQKMAPKILKQKIIFNLVARARLKWNLKN